MDVAGPDDNFVVHRLILRVPFEFFVPLLALVLRNQDVLLADHLQEEVDVVSTRILMMMGILAVVGRDNLKISARLCFFLTPS